MLQQDVAYGLDAVFSQRRQHHPAAHLDEELVLEGLPKPARDILLAQERVQRDEQIQIETMQVHRQKGYTEGCWR